MKIGNYRLGMRTFKTSFAVALCVLLFRITGRGTPMIAALAAVFSLRENWRSSMKFGRSRVVGNSIGAFIAFLLIVLQQYLGWNFVVELIGVPMAILLIIAFCDHVNYNAGIIGASAAFLIIYFTVPATESLTYAFERVVDTFIGSLIAVLVNRVLPGGPDVGDKLPI